MTLRHLYLLLAGAAVVTAAPASAAQDVAFPLVGAEGGLPALFDCVRESEALIISAHRGGPVAGYPENAIETFQNTLSRIPAVLEIDIAVSSDGTLVLMHDDTLDRTTTGQGPVTEQSLEALKQLRLVDNEGDATDYSIPTLSEALAWSEDRAVFVLDRKDPVTFGAIVEEVEAADAFDRVMFAAYTLDDAIAINELAPRAVIDVALEDPADVERLEAAGVARDRIIAWTGIMNPDPELYASLGGMGVESAFGTLGYWPTSWDNRIKALGDDGAYNRVLGGVHLVATDRMFELAAAVPAVMEAPACVRPPEN